MLITLRSLRLYLVLTSILIFASLYALIKLIVAQEIIWALALALICIGFLGLAASIISDIRDLMRPWLKSFRANGRIHEEDDFLVGCTSASLGIGLILAIILGVVEFIKLIASR